jgi:transcriptional antiterminator RfaH
MAPGDLLDRGNLASASESWWVLHTRPRVEKALADRCVRQGLSFYLPLHERQWRAQSRLRRSFVPLFPGYVFLYGGAEARLAALQTNLVANVLAVPDQRELLADLRGIRQLLASGAPLAAEPRLVPGAAVEITNGPLAGLHGRILRSGARLRFIVAVQFIQRAVSCEIEGWMLEARAAPTARAS